MAMHGKSILVTGAAGFLGREVLKQLQKRKALEPGIDRIIAIDNYDPLCGSQNLFPDIFGDIAMLPTVKWTHVIHLAAIGRNLTCEHNPYHAFKTNVGGTLNVLERAREQGAKVLFCSSNIVLSEYDSVYRMTKRTAEELCRVYARHGLDVMILRPSNIAGPGQSRTEFQPCCFAAMDKCFEDKGYIEITGDGSQQRDFIHVEDVARAFVLGLDRFISGATFDICTGRMVSMNEVVEILEAPHRYIEARKNDSKAMHSDPRPASNALNFFAKVPLTETIRNSFPSVMNASSPR